MTTKWNKDAYSNYFAISFSPVVLVKVGSEEVSNVLFIGVLN